MNYSKGQDLPTAELERCLEMFRAAGIKKILYSGGEPFARQDFVDVLAASEGIKTSFVSNGSLVKDEQLEAISPMTHVNRIRYSIDGFDSHDEMRGGSSWKQVLGRVKATTELIRRHISVVGQATATLKSLDDVPELVRLLQHAGADRFRMFLLRFSGEISNGKLALTAAYYDKYVQIIRTIARMCQDGVITLQVELDGGYQSDLEAVLARYEYPAFTEDVHPCQYLLHVLMVRSNGSLATCPFMQFPVGDIRDFKSIGEIELHVPLVAWRNFRAVDIDSCRSCRYLKICAGGCRKTAVDTCGTFRAADPVFCYLFPKIEKDVWPELPSAVQAHYARLLNTNGTVPDWTNDRLDAHLTGFRESRLAAMHALA